MSMLIQEPRKELDIRVSLRLKEDIQNYKSNIGQDHDGRHLDFTGRDRRHGEMQKSSQ